MMSGSEVKAALFGDVRELPSEHALKLVMFLVGMLAMWLLIGGRRDRDDDRKSSGSAPTPSSVSEPPADVELPPPEPEKPADADPPGERAD